jgi:hypothetical protein
VGTIAQLAIDFVAETAQFKREMAGVRAEVKSIGGRMDDMAKDVKRAALSYLSFETAKDILIEAAQAAMEVEQANARLGAVLKATGGAAGISANEIGRLSEAMQDSTLFDDEDVKNAAAELATFKNVHGAVFRQAIALSADLASVMGGDLPSAALRLGKMLDEPLQNLESLSRAGVTFNDVEKAHIKTLLEHNRVGEAQAAVLDKITGKVGGAAEQIAGAGGLTIAVHDLSVGWKELLEQMGGADSSPFGSAVTLKSLLSGTVDEIDAIKAFFGGSSNEMRTLTKELKAQQDILSSDAVDESKHGRRAVIAKQDAELRIASIQREIQALKDYDDAVTKAHSHAPGGTASRTNEDTPEAIAAREAARKKALEDRKKLQSDIVRLQKEDAAEVRSGLVGLNRATGDTLQASIDAWKDHEKVLADLRDASLAVDRARDDARLGDERHAAEQTEELWNHAVQRISDDFAMVFSDAFTGRIKTFREFCQEILDAWAQTEAQLAGTKLAGSIFGDLLHVGAGLTLPNSGPISFSGFDIPNPMGASVVNQHVTVNVAGTNATPAQITGAVLAGLRGSRGVSAAVARRTS